ncbi:MAG: glutaredoxin domain-containing protein [Candidatus Verstraetearchaeota archaeon]|nr:glutaredoxin domain-containing protein [Candidatus Verstraetearchaeota archaeon]
MKLELFTSDTCVNCRMLKKNLKEVLKEIGEDYGGVVLERNIDNDSDALADLLMLNLDSVPVIRIGNRVYEWDSVKERESLKRALMAHKK